MTPAIQLQLLLATLAGWVGHQQSRSISCLIEENRVLKEQLVEALDFNHRANGHGIRHPRKVLDEYVAYYNESRTHLEIEKDCPVPRSVDNPDAGEIVALPVLGGLHHRYTRQAA